MTLATVGGLAVKAKLPANPNSDTLMTQNVSATNATYPILLCPTANATSNQGAKTGIFATGVKVNPSTGEIDSIGAISTHATFVRRNYQFEKGTNPTSTNYWTLRFTDKNGSDFAANTIGQLESNVSSTGIVSTYLYAVKNAVGAGTPNVSYIACRYDTANDLAYADAPTPPAGDDSTKIATTHFVKNELRTEVEHLSGGRCTVVYDDNGNPNYMVVIPRFRTEDLFGTDVYGTGDFDIFNVGGKTATEILLSQYCETNASGKACSLPRKNPWTNINFDNSLNACRAKGANWTLAANQLWVARILWVQKHKGDENRIWHGNTNYGRDYYDKKDTGTFVTATTELPGDTSISDPVTLTGSGPLTWYDDESSWGVADAAGNVLGWFSGVRIVAGGEIQIIPSESVLLHTADFGANSSLWKAILPDGSLVTPGTVGTIKVDGVAADTVSSWTNAGRFRFTTSVENPSVKGYFVCDFRNMSVKDSLSLPAILVRHGLYPYSGATNYLCSWYAVQTLRENLCIRGGDWRGANGPLHCTLSYPRTNSTRDVGFRSAFVSYS